MLPALVQSLNFTYHNSKELESFLMSINAKYPDITHLHSIGKSVEGRDLWVIVLGKFPTKHTVGIPEFKYIGNMHGDEVVCREMLLQLVEHLVINYNTDPVITQMVNNARIHIMPTMNPDGFESSTPHCTFSNGRFNKNNYDLNRNFPDAFTTNTADMQPETLAVMTWIKSETFVLSANFHGGALVVSYPYDNSDPATDGKSPDEDVFIYLSKTYSMNHANMYKGIACDNANSFPLGMTNGYKWYPVQGGMQDYNYVFGQCFETTIEISCCKYPDAKTLSQFWSDNKVALIEYMKQVHLGIKGQVFDMFGAPIPNAIVEVQGRTHICPYRTNKNGEYYLLLLPGIYHFNVTVPGAPSIIKSLYVPENPNLSAMKYDFSFTVLTSSAESTCSPVTKQFFENSGKALKPFMLPFLLSTALLLLTFH
ncbi:hypothetical protein FKM82_012601 [Ascaphus truei]